GERESWNVTARIHVPRAASLAGYVTTALAALRHISLTTIQQPRNQIGEMAMRAVIRRIEKRSAQARRHVLAPELVCATPRRHRGEAPARAAPVRGLRR